jgi:hypothetical protein
MQLSSLIEGLLLSLILSLTIGFINQYDQNINFTLISFFYYFILSSIGYIIAVIYLKLSFNLPPKFKYLSHAIFYFIIIFITIKLNINSVVASGDLCVGCALITALTNNGAFKSRYNKPIKQDKKQLVVFRSSNIITNNF